MVDVHLPEHVRSGLLEIIGEGLLLESRAEKHQRGVRLHYRDELLGYLAVICVGLGLLSVLLARSPRPYGDDLLEPVLPLDGHGRLVLIQRHEDDAGLLGVRYRPVQPLELRLPPVALLYRQGIPVLEYQRVMLPDVLWTGLDGSQQLEPEVVLGEFDLLYAHSEGHPLLLRPLGAELVGRLLLAAGGGSSDQIPHLNNVVKVPDVLIRLDQHLDPARRRVPAEYAHTDVQ